MTPAELAALHAKCFTVPRPYSQAEFADFLSSPFCFFATIPNGFALGRVIADEAELLTLVVDPDHRQQGLGHQLLNQFEATAQTKGATKAFLEVAANNAPALTLYTKANYRESGRRAGYYQIPDGINQDAILMEKPLNLA